MKLRGDRVAFGAPGMEPRWTHGNKDGVGTAYSQDSKLWFTLWRGIVTEVYYPLIDHPQLRDLEYLVTDGRGLFHEEKRHLESHTTRLSAHGMGYRVVAKDPDGRYELHKEVISAPHLPCLLVHTQLRPAAGELGSLRLHALAAPHLDVGGAGNNAAVQELPGRTVLTAERNGTWLAMGADVPFCRASVGYVGHSDGWTDLHEHGAMTWEFDAAPEGNVALTGELDLAQRREFTLGLAFGRSGPQALAALLESLATPFVSQRARFEAQWDRVWDRAEPLVDTAGDGGTLLHASYGALLAHEDKTFPGAYIASLSIPWGYAKGDADRGGYHLVWTRDLVQIALGLLAAGDRESPRRALTYLVAIQKPDGGFSQNFWLDGRSYWNSVQLDEVAFPILLAWRLRDAGALGELDPYPMVLAAARYLLERGPVTPQERWEEAAGYSPSTLAATIAAVLCAASFARDRDDPRSARLLEEYGDFLEGHLEEWTATRHGTLVRGEPRHFLRIRPADPEDPVVPPMGDPGEVTLANQPPEAPVRFPAAEIVDGGFLELVRFGVRAANDPLIEASVRVVDAALKVSTPAGAVGHRYNHDGYGDREDGGAYVDWGTGRAWPLLSGERGHYELAAGRDARPFLRTIEKLATPTGMLPEQVWDGPSRPGLHQWIGRPTEAAMPLAWAHAEYLKLLRSVRDGKVVDRLAPVASRYAESGQRAVPVELWLPRWQPTEIVGGRTLRIQTCRPFRLHWSDDDWRTVHDTNAEGAAVGIWWVDLPALRGQSARYTFTFYWEDSGAWEGRDYAVAVRRVGPR